MTNWIRILLAIMAATGSAAAQTPTERVKAIRAEIAAALSTVPTQLGAPADDAKLVAQLEAAAARADANLTSDLMTSYEYPLADDDRKVLHSTAKAVSLWRPCLDAIAAVEEPQRHQLPATAEQLEVAEQACNAFAGACRGEMMHATANAASHRVRKVRDDNPDLVGAAHVRAARAEFAAEQARLAQTSVRGRFPEFTTQDAFDPAKIAEAFAKAPAELVYSQTAALTRADTWIVDEAKDCDSGGSKKSVSSDWSHNGQASSVEMFDGDSNDVVGVPVLIWERQDRGGTFVTIDGLRYTTGNLDELVHGAPPVARWPKKPRHTCLTEQQVEKMEAAGRLKAGSIAAIRPSSKALDACIQRTWQSGAHEFRANDVANINASTRANRYSALLDRYTTQVEKSCGPQRRAYEAAMLGVINTYAKYRQTALDAATAALGHK